MMDDDSHDEAVCPECGRHFDRPGFYGECESSHPRPSVAQRLAEELEGCLSGRKGLFHIGTLDYYLQREIRDEMAELIDTFLATDGYVKVQSVTGG